MLICIGFLSKRHGLNGELKLLPYFAYHLKKMIGKKLYLKKKSSSDFVCLKLLFIRGALSRMIAKFETIDTPEDADRLSSSYIMIEKEKLPPLEDGEYYYEEIIGLDGFNEDGKYVGSLVDFFEAGEKDVWLFRKENGEELMIPYIDEMVLKVDLANKKIIVKEFDTI